MSGFVVEVEEAPGPGVEFERDLDFGVVGVRTRAGQAWLGFDRAALVDSDDGLGRRVGVVVALPASTFGGAHLRVELHGGWRVRERVTLVAGLPGAARPGLEVAAVVAGVGDDAVALDRVAAEREARAARVRFRERRGRERIVGGRAWQPSVDEAAPETSIHSTPHSAAEYSLRRVPVRFVAGLRRLLEDDERILYWVERPPRAEVPLARRIRGGVDRRAAALVLTDRQLVWLVDHMQPDRYLSEWGVDAELIPVERVEDARAESRSDLVRLIVRTPAGARSFDLPAEFAEEVGVMCLLLGRFTPRGARGLPRRTHDPATTPFDRETAERFGALEAADSLLAAADREGPFLAFLFSPGRPGRAEGRALVLRHRTLELLDASGVALAVELASVASIGITLSSLVCRLSAGPGLSVVFPGGLIDRVAAFARTAREAMAAM